MATSPRRVFRCAVAAFAVLCPLSGLAALTLAAPAEPGNAISTPVRLEVLPPVISLRGPMARQQLLVSAVYADGTRRDVTDKAVLRPADALSAHLFTPTGAACVVTQNNGTGHIAVSFGGTTTRLALSVQNAHASIAPSFVADVIPTLSRLGCNQGTCHGAAQGKGGFKLSLRGYAPEADWFTLTRQLGGRRVSREAPEQSLFLRKPLAEVSHRGGKVLDKTDPDYRLLLAWVQNGAPGPTTREPVLTKLAVLPQTRQMLPGVTQRLLVRAVYSDGTSEDVTHRALFAANDPTVTTVEANGVVTQARPGEGTVIVKYRDRLTTARFSAPYPFTVPPPAYPSPQNFVDRLVYDKLRELHIAPSGPCTDAEFLRRAYLDAVGTLPTETEARVYLDDKRPDKRARLVDELLARPEWGMVWALKFGDLLDLRREAMSRKNAQLLQQWIADQFNANRPWDKTATELLTAAGDPSEVRPALYFISRTPQQEGERYWIRRAEATSEMTAQVFLGARIGCAKCHNHPTEKTTQDDYYHFVALWRQVTGKGDRDGILPERLEASGAGEVRQPRTNELMEPRPLDRARLTFAKNEDRRVQAARWLTHQLDFARAMVNRVWARCFGRGLVEPVDDIRSTNPAANEPLMQALCADFVSHGYDTKRLMAVIMQSGVYQLSSAPNTTNKNETRLFARRYPRRLGAEEMVDAVCQVTGVPEKYQQLPLGARALELADSEIPSGLLDTFGRPVRVAPTEGERTCAPAVNQALALLNGEAVSRKVRDDNGVLPIFLKSGKTDAQIIESLYLSALSRRPTPAETTKLTVYIKADKNRTAAFQDVLWAILNTKEFLFVR